MGLTQHQKIVLGFGLVLGLGVFSVWAFKKYSKASSNGEAKVKIERIPKRKRKRTPTQSDSIEVISEEITTVSSPSVVKSKKSIQEGERSIESIPVENVVSTDNDHKLSVEKTMSLCDAPIAELMSLSAESKQRVFYALLMQGEALMTKDVQGLTKAIKYFSKAIAIVPNPQEVIKAFETTLPPPIFSKLIEQIQLDLEEKVRDYFESLLMNSTSNAYVNKNLVKFEVKPGEKAFLPVAKQKIPVATIVWEEWADVSSLSAFLHSDDFCDHCLVPLSNCHGLVECKQCKPSAESSKHKVTRFCSQECLRLGTENFHGFYCKAPKTVHEQIESLKVECREMGQTMPLLVLRYLTILLKEELAGRGTASGVGPFTHYDHLRPQFRSASNEQDRSEAAMLRRIVSSVNENVAEFLTDDIYVTMKGTLATNVIGTHPNPILPTQLTPMQTRQVNSTASILSLFHMAAHLQHSCDPNVALIPGIQPSPVVTKSSMEIDNEEISERKAMSLKVTALRGISPGEVLTMSYLPFEDKTTRAERRLHLKRVFSFDCKCARCEREA